MNIKLTDEENLVIQPIIIGELLLNLKNKNFLESKYFKENFNDWFITSLKTMTLDSQGMVIILFYTYLVVPKEILENELSSEYAKLNNEIENLINKNICQLTSNYSDKNYLKHMRNAVAHVNLKFVGEKSITFFDDNGHGDKFELTMPLQIIHIILANLMNIVVTYFKNKKD